MLISLSLYQENRRSNYRLNLKIQKCRKAWRSICSLLIFCLHGEMPPHPYKQAPASVCFVVCQGLERTVIMLCLIPDMGLSAILWKTNWTWERVMAKRVWGSWDLWDIKQTSLPHPQCLAYWAGSGSNWPMIGSSSSPSHFQMFISRTIGVPSGEPLGMWASCWQCIVPSIVKLCGMPWQF